MRNHRVEAPPVSWIGRGSGRAAASTPRVLFVGSLYAGHRTRFLNLRAHTADDPRLIPTYRSVSGWVDGGLVERLGFLPAGLRGRARALLEASAVARLPRPDVIWTSVAEAAVPWLLPMIGPLRRPLILDLDSTFEQLDAMAEAYQGRAPRRGLALRRSLAVERVLFRRTTMFTPWSHWAAEGLVRRGVDPAQIRVLPPGVDLDAWKSAPPSRRDHRGPLRLLFVGGNFERKGGDLLIDVMRDHLGDRCTLDVVTHDDVPPTAGVRVHRAAPNSPELKRLFEAADVFVMPTRADCFGIACVEAMAAGLPVVMGDVGGARDIVDEGRTGWLIPARHDALARVLDHAVAHRAELPAMGQAARAVAEARFDGRRNDEAVAELVIEQATRHARTRA